MARLLPNLETVLLANYPTFGEKGANFRNKHHQLQFPASLNCRFRTVLAMSQNAGNQPQKITVLNDQSEKLVGLLHDTGSKDVVIVCHGFTGGGDVVLLYASKYHDIHMVVNLSGRYDLKKGISERLGEEFMERIKTNGSIDVKCKKSGKVLYRVTKENLMDRLNMDMHEASLRIDKNCRVLTVHGSADEIAPVENAYEFSKIIPNHKLHIIEEANHSFSEHQVELHQVVIDFIKLSMQHDKESVG